MPSLFTELRRRNVFKVGAAYAIVAWLLVQVVDVVLPALQMPEWTVSFVTVLLIIGFPITLIMAWAYEMTPEGIKAAADAPRDSITPATGQRLNYVILGLVVLAVGFLVTDQYVLDQGMQASVIEDDSSITRPLREVSRVTITVPSESVLGRGAYPPVAISPDGRRLVFVVEPVDGSPQLYLRSLEQFGAVPMPGTENAVSPFFSPDGDWVGFWANGMVQKVAVEGGAPIKICDLPQTYRGASWGPDDIIILGGNNTGLEQVSAGGGMPMTITNTAIDKVRTTTLGLTCCQAVKQYCSLSTELAQAQTRISGYCRWTPGNGTSWKALKVEYNQNTSIPVISCMSVEAASSRLNSTH